ncbi:uncharacterized protein LOC122385493 [Amphibalanus amphitrite]|uniref:uncharacterized protein LOC122385493 n=1 Tax=Amphibalanus amphitrite TaxID=1232801 RepID=UPI001C917405|nr:uncharacterized protein LOC122385493 [Amphibalanus amphitrite]
MLPFADNFPFGEIDVDAALWNLTYSFDDIFDICASFYNKPCDQRDISSHLYHYGGQCHTLRYDNSLAEGRQRGLMLQLKPQHCENCSDLHWVMYVFSAKEEYLDWEHVWAPTRIYLQKDTAQTFKVTRTLEKRLSTPEKPCNGDQGYTQAKCIRECLSSEMAQLGAGCRLPWHDSSQPFCNNRSDYEELLRYSRMVSRAYVVWEYDYQELRENHYYKTVNSFKKVCKSRCMRECDRDHVTVTLVDRARSDRTFITLSINDGLYVSSQRRAYDLQQMMSDIGGNLGLLLGASIFTLFEMVENAARHLWERRKRRKAKVSQVTTSAIRTDAFGTDVKLRKNHASGFSDKEMTLSDVS